MAETKKEQKTITPKKELAEKILYLAKKSTISTMVARFCNFSVISATNY